ncbi:MULTISPECIES: hypothetical protein [Shewanella]|uniref:RiboL-PSP-HEPN domain-containing protein n=1 Tax=Shewanella indica TaxID=768528 RepID=A0ABU4QIP8_9GAMM|nr:hypothetical protein [Shewanella indica]MDX6017216.1 hypothetical protein [Shewanella indica]
MAKQTFKFPLSGSRNTTTIRSHNLFDSSYNEPNKAPIDIYEENMLTYKRLVGCFTLDVENNQYISLAEIGNKEWNNLSNLLILGFISSVESYLRKIIRKVLLIDNTSRNRSYNKSISYGAASYHSRELLPEALIEDCSFHSAYNIKEAVKDMLGINLNDLKNKPELKTAFDDYNFIAELRHCVVHRCGFFGSNNALTLGIEQYKDFLEKPIKLNITVLLEAANACDNLVKELNDVIFSELLSRSLDTYPWTGNLTQDKNYFDKYFYIFSPENKHVERLTCYHNFRDTYNLKFRARTS